jgi:hypothetical protein
LRDTYFFFFRFLTAASQWAQAIGKKASYYSVTLKIENDVQKSFYQAANPE